MELGDDFSWQWGFALPPAAETPWSLVFDQMTDRGRNQALELKLSCGKAPNSTACSCTRSCKSGRKVFGPDAPRQIPKAHGAGGSELTTDVPANFQIHAARSADWLDCRFSADDLAQIILPNELDLGVTIINEVSGCLTLQGVVKGEQVSMEGRGFFEFLT